MPLEGILRLWGHARPPQLSANDLDLTGAMLQSGLVSELKYQWISLSTGVPRTEHPRIMRAHCTVQCSWHKERH